MRRALITLGLGVVIAAALVVAAQPSSPAPTRDGPPNGSDPVAGTARWSWRALDRAIRSARPGETVVLQPGVYGSRGRRTDWSVSGTAKKPITFEGSTNGTTTILGYNKVEGSHLRLIGLSFQGPTGPVDPRTATNPDGEEVMVWMAGRDDDLEHCNVADSHWHAGVYVSGPGDVRLIANYIRYNGAFGDGAQANLDQGVYWGNGTSGLIADNVIVYNLANGVQLYPAARNVIVEQNTIADNGKAGVIVAEDATGNTIVNNIVAANPRNSIRSFDLHGAHNMVENNLVWNNGDGNIGADAHGLTLRGNIRANPLFVGNGDYQLSAGSPAIGRALRTSFMLSYDITGAARSPHADIGAYQGP